MTNDNWKIFMCQFWEFREMEIAPNTIMKFDYMNKDYIAYSIHQDGIKRFEGNIYRGKNLAPLSKMPWLSDLIPYKCSSFNPRVIKRIKNNDIKYNTRGIYYEPITQKYVKISKSKMLHTFWKIHKIL